MASASTATPPSKPRRQTRTDNRHVISKRPGKVHACKFCSKTFTKKDHVQRHERGHTKEKPYRCGQCGRSYGRRDTLLRHEKTHGPKPSRAERELQKVEEHPGHLDSFIDPACDPQLISEYGILPSPPAEHLLGPDLLQDHHSDRVMFNAFGHGDMSMSFLGYPSTHDLVSDESSFLLSTSPYPDLGHDPHDLTATP